MRKIKQLLKEAAQGVYLPNNYLLPPLENYSPIEKKQGNLVIFQMNNILHHLPISDKYIRQCSLVWSRI